MFQLSKIATPRLLVAVLVVVLVGTVLILQIAGRGLIGTAITSFKTPAPVRDVAAAGAYAYVITEDHILHVGWEPWRNSIHAYGDAANFAPNFDNEFFALAGF